MKFEFLWARFVNLFQHFKIPDIIPAFRLLRYLYNAGLKSHFRKQYFYSKRLKRLKNCIVYWQPCLLATHSEVLKVCSRDGSSNPKRGKNIKFPLTFSQPYSPHWNVNQPSKCSQSKKCSGRQTRKEDYVNANKAVFWYGNQIISISVIHPCSWLSGD